MVLFHLSLTNNFAIIYCCLLEMLILKVWYRPRSFFDLLSLITVIELFLRTLRPAEFDVCKLSCSYVLRSLMHLIEYTTSPARRRLTMSPAMGQATGGFMSRHVCGVCYIWGVNGVSAIFKISAIFANVALIR